MPVNPYTTAALVLQFACVIEASGCMVLPVHRLLPFDGTVTGKGFPDDTGEPLLIGATGSGLAVLTTLLLAVRVAITGIGFPGVTSVLLNAAVATTPPLMVTAPETVTLGVLSTLTDN